MSTPAWPSGLQQFLNQENFSFEFGETVLRSQNDVGPDKVRRRSTRSIDKINGSILLSVSEFSVFKTFFNTTINGGASRFTAPHPITGVTTEFRFVSPPSVRNIGGVTFALSFGWEELP